MDRPSNARTDPSADRRNRILRPETVILLEEVHNEREAGSQLA